MMTIGRALFGLAVVWVIWISGTRYHWKKTFHLQKLIFHIKSAMSSGEDIKALSRQSRCFEPTTGGSGARTEQSCSNHWLTPAVG
jgi:hypothetical protein